jgi:hypothetical protein
MKLRESSWPVALLVAYLCLSCGRVHGCTVEVVGLRDEFRRSKNVFIGEVLAVEGVRKDKLPTRLAEDWNQLDKITLRIKKSWKGKGVGTISIFSDVSCTCPMRFLTFEVGKEFVILADRDGFASACSFRNINTSDDRFNELLGNDLRRLNNFWFRAWASIYPF